MFAIAKQWLKNWKGSSLPFSPPPIGGIKSLKIVLKKGSNFNTVNIPTAHSINNLLLYPKRSFFLSLSLSLFTCTLFASLLFAFKMYFILDDPYGAHSAISCWINVSCFKNSGQLNTLLARLLIYLSYKRAPIRIWRIEHVFSEQVLQIRK